MFFSQNTYSELIGWLLNLLQFSGSVTGFLQTFMVLLCINAHNPAVLIVYVPLIYQLAGSILDLHLSMRVTLILQLIRVCFISFLSLLTDSQFSSGNYCSCCLKIASVNLTLKVISLLQARVPSMPPCLLFKSFQVSPLLSIYQITMLHLLQF